MKLMPGAIVAQCPQCHHAISAAEFIFNGGWMTILCKHCHSKLFIRDRDFFIWYCPCALFLFAVGLLVVTRLDVRSLVLGILVALLSTGFYFATGWHFTKLIKK